MTLQEITYAIRNNVSNGLKGVTNEQYSLKQLEQEVCNVRNQIILDNSKQGVIKLDYFSQKMENVPVRIKGGIPYVQIHKLAMTLGNTALLYFGPPDLSLNFKQYFDGSYTQHKYNRVTGKRPYIFIDLAHDADGMSDVFLYNMSQADMHYVTVRAIFSDPIKILNEDGLFGEDEEFPAPSSIQEKIIDNLSSKYVQYYRQLNHPNQPNTQTDTK